MNKSVEGTHIEDFLNPKSMPTPAAAGAVVALIAGALFKSFGISIAYCTIILSFMVGMIVLYSKEFKSDKTSRIVKIVLYIINSLIIFAMATGTNSVMAAEVIDQKRPLFFDWTKTTSDLSTGNIDLSNPDFEIKVEVVNNQNKGFKGWLQNKGIITKEYDTIIKLVPKTGNPSYQLKSVDIILPQKEFETPKVSFTPDQLKNGLNIKAWKGFPVEAQITTESGENIKLFQYIEPENLIK
ncbi:MAG: hypothetical protein PF503_16280 [Desulfobacula sp.]|jgi:hypothetical protein|nr:hypothetical protein [Desulfobacula sp.]